MRPGLDWDVALTSLAVAVAFAQASSVQLYAGRAVGAPSPSTAYAPFPSSSRATFIPATAAAMAAPMGGLGASPILGIVLGSAAALVLAALLGGQSFCQKFLPLFY